MILHVIQTTNSRSISELYDKCSFSDWQEICLFPKYHELIKTALELNIKKSLDEQRSNMWIYACKLAAKNQTPCPKQFECFDYIFNSQGINPKYFAKCLHSILMKTESKINCLRIIGVPNSGKTLISNCIVEPFICCRMNNHGSENEFFMSNMLNKSIIQCEELYITIATAEDFKSILGGQPLDIAKKFNEKQLLSRTPVIITSNYSRFGRGHVPPTDEAALVLRCFDFRFSVKVCPPMKLEWQQFYLYMLSHMF